MRRAFELTGSKGAAMCPYSSILRGRASAIDDGYTVVCKSFAKGSVNLYFAFDSQNGPDYLIGGWSEEMFTGAKQIDPLTLLSSEFARIQVDEALKLQEKMLKERAASPLFSGLVACVMILSVLLFATVSLQTEVLAGGFGIAVIIAGTMLFLMAPFSEWLTREKFARFCSEDETWKALSKEQSRLSREATIRKSEQERDSFVRCGF